MPVEDLLARQNYATLPVDPNDPPRFSQLSEIVKDAFQVNLTNFFNLHLSQYSEVQSEIPTIAKFALGYTPQESPAESFARILLQHPDILEKLPLVAITAASGNVKKLSYSPQLVGATQMPARVKGTNPGPYAFQAGDKIAFATTPNGSKTPVISYVGFVPGMFQNFSAATLTEVVAAAKVQLLYVTCKTTVYSTPQPLPRFDAYGVLSKVYPNQITVLPPPYSTANALAQLGFTAGQTDTTANHPVSNRYHLSGDYTVALDIGCEDENQRREMTDLVDYYFSLDQDKRQFTLYGRSIFDDEFLVPGPNGVGIAENYQIVFLDRHSLAGEAELPRNGGDPQDLIYINRVSIPVTVIDYVDRQFQAPYGYLDPTKINPAASTQDMPLGDFALIHTNPSETSNGNQ